MKIFAHRGINKNYSENTYQALKAALDFGFSVETDVRFGRDKKLIISHDELLESSKSSEDIFVLSDFLSLIKEYKGTDLAALHIKEPYNRELLETVSGSIQGNCLEAKIFVFDVEKNLIDILRRNFPKVKIGLSVSEKKYIPILYFLEEVVDSEFADVIWADEWEGGLYDSYFFKKIAENSKKSYVISPELHKNLSVVECKQAWKELIAWGVDGICTDYPEEFAHLYNTLKI